MKGAMHKGRAVLGFSAITAAGFALLTACAASDGGSSWGPGTGGGFGGSGSGGSGSGSSGGKGSSGSGGSSGSSGSSGAGPQDGGTGGSTSDRSYPPPSPPPGGNAGATCWSTDFNITYDDGPSLCTFVNQLMNYYQNSECALNTYWPKQLTVDPTLMSQAQAEAEAVANGAAPQGTLSCAEDPCVTDPIQSQDEWFYMDGDNANLMYTAPESTLVIGPGTGYCPPANNGCGMPADYMAAFDGGMGGTIPMLDCHFTNNITAARADIYHFCPGSGPKPSRMGCGSAVDANGKAWRVLLEGP